MEYCKKGLTCAKKQNNPLQYIFSAKAVSLYSNMCCYAKAIEASDEYFRSKQEKLGTDLEVCYLKAESSFLLGRYHDAILCYKDYFEEYKQAQGKNAVDMLRHPVLCADGVSYRIAILRMAKANMEEGDYKSALAYLRSLTAADYQSDRDNITYWLDMEIGIMKKTGDFSGIIDLYGQLDAVSREVFQALIEREMFYQADRDSIIKAFKAYRDTKEAYLWLLKLRSEYYDGSLSAESVQDFLSSMTVLTPLFADTIYFAVKAGLPLASFTQKVDPLDIGRFFYFNTAYHFSDLADLVYGGYGEGIDTDAGIQMWLSSLYYLELTAGRLCEEYVAGMFKAYAKSMFNAMTELFKEEMLQEGNLQLLPRQFRAGYYCYMAVNALDTGKDSEYIRYLRTILKHCPQMGKVVKLLESKHRSILKSNGSRNLKHTPKKSNRLSMIL
jgi:tetratricopeptide (TPR) repeat protein